MKQSSYNIKAAATAAGHPTPQNESIKLYPFTAVVEVIQHSCMYVGASIAK